MQPVSRAKFALLMAVAALGPISTDLYLPSLPAIGESFAANQAAIQATLSIFLIGFAFSVLLCGSLSDKWGRKPVLLAALLAFSVASFLCALAPSIEMLWLFRLLQALAAGAGPVITRAIVRDTHHATESVRMMSFLSAGVSVAPLIGPFIGGLLQTYFGWQANFIFLAFYSACCAILVFLYLTETNNSRGKGARSVSAMLHVYKLLLRNPTFIGYVLCAGFAFSGMFSFISGSSFVFITTLQIEPRFFGFCFGVFVLGFMSGAYLGGRLIKKSSPHRVILIGTIISLSAGLLLVLAALLDLGIIWLVAPLFPYMLGMGMIGPSAQGAAIAPHPESAGAAGGLLNFISIIMASTTGALLGQIPIESPLPMNLFMAGGAFMVLCTFYLVARPAMKSF